jgi:two-component system C4-dicarboxylate transport response regulator DctD
MNCGGLPEALFESELFGHEAGAFTGAKRRIGKIEHASGGTLFLDEIETMPMALQIKLLRALQERSIERLGSNEDHALHCARGRRQQGRPEGHERPQAVPGDLYYRLGVAFIELPPLRERREDIPLLFEHFTLQAAARYERPAPRADATRSCAELMAHDWPGNVREMRNAADRFVLGLLGERLTQARGGSAEGVPALPRGLPQQVESFERAVIVEELRRQRGDQPATAAALGIARQTLHDKVRKLGVAVDEFK